MYNTWIKFTLIIFALLIIQSILISAGGNHHNNNDIKNNPKLPQNKPPSPPPPNGDKYDISDDLDEIDDIQNKPPPPPPPKGDKDDISGDLDEIDDILNEPDFDPNEASELFNQAVKRKTKGKKHGRQESRKFFKNLFRLTKRPQNSGNLQPISTNVTVSVMNSLSYFLENGVEESNDLDEIEERKNELNNLKAYLEDLVSEADLDDTNDCGTNEFKCRAIIEPKVLISRTNIENLTNGKTFLNCDPNKIFGYEGFNNGNLSLGILNETNLNSFINTDQSELTAFYLNYCEFIKNNIQDVSTVILDNSDFTGLNTKYSPSSFIMASVLRDKQNKTVKSNLEINLFFNKTNSSENNMNILCGFWDETKLDWSTEGCSLVQIENNGLYKCQCIHTTYFALISGANDITNNSTTSTTTDTLPIVYTVLVGISILFGIIVVALFGRKGYKINRDTMVGRPSYFTMLSALFASVAYILSSIFMIAILFRKYEEFTVSCTVLVTMEHFFLLIYFFWLLNTVLMNYFTVKFKLTHIDKWFKPLAILSIGFPFCLTLIIFCVQFSDNAYPYELRNNLCWFTHNYIIGTVIVPIAIICIINLVFIILIVYARYTEEYKFKGKGKLNLFTLLTCLLFSGVTWLGLPFTMIFHESSLDGFLYFFTITNSLQGFFIFFHFVFTVRLLANKKSSQRKPMSFNTSSDIIKEKQ